MKPATLELSSHQNLQKILKGETDIEDYIKKKMKKMSFDLYLYVNGVDKNKYSR